MGYFDDPKHVDEYIAMVDGFDGAELLAVLARHLPTGSSVLELGMGPGKDLDLLSKTYAATGSDSSTVFLDRYRQVHPDADVLQLDAVTIDTERTFDCIYSNKVLVHLTSDELARSFRRQAEVLTAGGVVLHSLWRGEGEEFHEGLRFTYYEKDALLALIGETFEVVEAVVYAEAEPDDSLYLVLRRK